MELNLVTDENSTSQFTQTCHMSVELMMNIGANIRSCIKIQEGTEETLCVVYPQHGLTDDVITYSKAVTKMIRGNDVSQLGQIDGIGRDRNLKNPIRDTTEIKTSSTNYGDESKSNIIPSDSEIRGNSLKVMKVGNAKVVSIRVVFKDYSKLNHYRNNSCVLEKLQNQCRNCLCGLVIADSYTVDFKHMHLAELYGIAYIYIEKLKGSKRKVGASCLTVTKTTEIDIVQLHSVEWFEHMRLRKISSNLGGLSNIVRELLDLIEMPIYHREKFKHLGIKPPKGILLRGPPGCGKTSLVKHVAYLSQAYLIVINGPEVLGSLPGETENNLEEIFNKAKLMSAEGPCILFIDEIDSLCPKGSKSSKLQQGRVTGKLVGLLDGLDQDQSIVVIGATNRPSVLDPAIRRPGRMDREVSINPPTLKQRREILEVYLKNLPVTSDLDLDMLSDVTNGYVGADLAALCQEAAYIAMMNEGKLIGMEDLLTSVKKIRPSLQRGTEGIVDLRPVYWSDIGGLEKVKAEIRQAVEWPLKHPEAFIRMGLSPSKGVLLYGPPGCCKTTLVRAAATSCHATFLSISGAQLYSPFVGDSERLVSETFQKARMSSPSIIFLDEIDSIVGKRSESGRSGVQDRVLSTLLNEMDGVGIRLNDSYGSSGNQKMLEGESDGSKVPSSSQSADTLSNNSVLLVAASNRPDLLDEALMRPGRMDKIIYVPQPDKKARQEILNVYTKNMGIGENEIDIVTEKTELYTGADLENLCREAALCSLTENMKSEDVQLKHFIKALNSVKPSLNEDLIQQYSRLKMSGR